MFSSSTKGINIPGGWGKDTREGGLPTYSDADVSERDLAAGVVGESGDVVNQTGQVVGNITEGEPKDLAGNVVTTTGDIVDKSGDPVGRANPVDNSTEKGPADAPRKGGWTVMGTVKNISKLAGTVDNTVQTAEKAAPVAGKVTKALGLGGKQQQDEPGKSADTEKAASAAPGSAHPGSVKDSAAGTTPSHAGNDAPADVQNIADGGDDTPRGPVEMRDNEAGPSVNGSRLPTEYLNGERALPNGTDINDVQGGVPAASKVDDIQDEAPAASQVEGAKSEVPIDTPDTQDEQKVADEATSNVPEGDELASVAPKTDEAKSAAGDELASVAPKTDEAKSAASDVVEDVEGTRTDLPPEEGLEAGSQLGTQPLGGSDVRDMAQEATPTEGKKSRASIGSKLKSALSAVSGVKSAASGAQDVAEPPAAPFGKFEGAVVSKDGMIMVDDRAIGRLVDGDPTILEGMKVDANGNILNVAGSIVGRASLNTDVKEELQKEQEDLQPQLTEKPLDQVTQLTSPFGKFEGAVVAADGRVLVDDKSIGRVVEGDPANLAGMQLDTKGNIVNEAGSIVGRASLKTDIREELLREKKFDQLTSPFEKFEGAVVGKDGKIMFEDRSIGKVVEGDPAALEGKFVDIGGNIIDDTGSILGRASLKTNIREELKAEKAARAQAFAALKGARVNKAGNLVNDSGEVVGRVTQGILKLLIGKKCDENGKFWNDAGQVIGQAEPIPENEREEFREPAPFEDFPDAIVQSNGDVVYEGEVIGKVVEGDLKKLKGKKVDEDGDILDRNGNVIGRAERWEAPEAEPEPEKDRSILAGKRVNKAGNVVDTAGVIYGRVVEGDVRRMIGRMCDKDGNVRSESGDIIGRAEVVSEGEREGFKDGPFAELLGCTVARDGKVVTPSGDVVGRLVAGDPKVLIGRPVDEDGDVLDRNGNVIGRAERWEEPEVEKKRGPMAGRRINREGNVVDEDGNVIGRLTSGDLTICSGKEIDDDGDVVNSKGQVIGHASLLEEIPPEPELEEPGETPEEREKREQEEHDRKLAKQIAFCIEQSLDRIRPICKMITDKMQRAERTPKEELDEEELVKQVRPLIEEGGRILQEAYGVIRGLDPDGHIQANAKHRSATRDATPEEFHLAEVLKELTGVVTETIENAKRVIEDMPHAKKELNPLWGLLNEPLFQILAAVGLLLSGVLGLVGRLLSGLGLGGILDHLLGTLGLNRLLESLGVGSLTTALKGKKKK